MASEATTLAWGAGVHDTTTIPLEGNLQDVATPSGDPSSANVEKDVVTPEWLKRSLRFLGLQSGEGFRNPESASGDSFVSTDEKVLQALRAVVVEHFEIETTLHLIAIYAKQLPHEFLLIEVNDEAIPTGNVEPFYFAAGEDFTWPMFIADVTRDEWTSIEKGTMKLPRGWPREPMLIFHRDGTAGQ